MSEFADKHRYLSQENSRLPGRWKTSFMPFLQEPMDSYNDPAIRTVVFLKSSQVGWTEVLLNVILFIIINKPGPVMYIMPKIEAAKSFTRKRVEPMIRDCPILKGVIKDKNKKDSENTLNFKKFPGGSYKAVGANSATDLSSDPIRDLFVDETRGYADSAGGEGNPIRLGLTRQTMFGDDATTMIGSSPSIKGSCEATAWFERGDQRRWFVPCPHCGGVQVLKWGDKDSAYGVKWDDPAAPWYECEHCHEKLSQTEVTRAMYQGHWRATAEPNDPTIRSYHIWSIYNPLVPMSKLVAEFLACKDDLNELQTFVNTKLGEAFEPPGMEVDDNDLMARREVYGAEVPAGVLLLTAGVDVQDDRLECLVVGWGEGEESWRINWATFTGDVSDTGASGPWGQLWAYLNMQWQHERYGTMSIEAVGVDTRGHNTDSAYEFCRKHSGRCYALAGVGGFDKPIVGRPTHAQRGKSKKRLALYPVGDHAAKMRVLGRLKVDKPGPRYMHLPHHFDEEYAKQVTAERLVKIAKKGKKTRYEWQTLRERNEALDMEKYNLAALLIRTNGKPDWEGMHQRHEDALTKALLGHEPAKATPPARASIGAKRRRPGGYIKRW